MPKNIITRLLTVPTAAVKAGDFSATDATMHDPNTGKADGTGSTPFPENRIPLVRQSAITRKMQSLLPAPNLSGNASNYFASAASVFDRDNFDAKLNYSRSAKATLWANLAGCEAMSFPPRRWAKRAAKA